MTGSAARPSGVLLSGGVAVSAFGFVFVAASMWVQWFELEAAAGAVAVDFRPADYALVAGIGGTWWILNVAATLFALRLGEELLVLIPLTSSALALTFLAFLNESARLARWILRLVGGEGVVGDYTGSLSFVALGPVLVGLGSAAIALAVSSSRG